MAACCGLSFTGTTGSEGVMWTVDRVIVSEYDHVGYICV